MDAAGYREELRVSAGRMKWWSELGGWRRRQQQQQEEEEEEEEEEELVEVLLQGRAPWGFTVRGGTEHREPLIITKVEQGSVAAAVHLQAGDEMVSVNAVALCGSRQEAIALVKSSHGSLTLQVRRRSDARPRPHTWHSSKLTEESDRERQASCASSSNSTTSSTSPAAVWQPQHDTRVQEPPEEVPAQLSSPFSMERVERPPHPQARLSPPKYPEPACGPGAKRDSGLSCFSSSSSPPVHDSSQCGRRGASSENIFFKGLQGDAASAPHYLPGGGWEEQPACRVSVAGRPRPGPVWQLPERKKSQSPPPPPPPPPLRSDSFTATKVFPYSEGPRSRGRSVERLTDGYNPPPPKDLLHPSSAADHSLIQLQPSRLFSLSSCDVRQPQVLQRSAPQAPLHLHSSSAPAAKTQSVGSYYRSLQELPTGSCSRRPARHSSAALENGVQARPPRPGFPGACQTSSRAKYAPPLFQTPYSDSKERPLQPAVTSDLPEGQSEDTKRPLPPRPRPQDPWVPQDDQRITALKTPLLHSLAQESRVLGQASANQDAAGGKLNRRSDRYATTLRNEIQQKRAQLQKSRSAATLTCTEAEDEAEDWRSLDASSNTYKDHLKEAQARVLQATSFQRRDLEPCGPEPGPAPKTSGGRIRGRKRLPLAKRTHSFSEPDKMDKVGVEGEAQSGSFGERRRFFETRPAFSRPVLKSSPAEGLEKTPPPSSRSPEPSPEPSQQRLGTFAEYQATWSQQKKPAEAKTQGRFHSAENILDADAAGTSVVVHERSRSSPSAEFYTQNVPAAWRDARNQQSSYSSRLKETRLLQPPDHSPQLSPSGPWEQGPAPGPAPSPAPGPADHRPVPDAARSPGPRSPGPQLPPRLFLGPETTSCSQEFPAGAQAEAAAFQPGSSPGSDTQREPLQPSSSSSSSLQLSAAERARSPSPQFSPRRLTDRPPAGLLQDGSGRVDPDLRLPLDMDMGSPVRKVPVRIVHSESSLEREGRAYLSQSAEPCSAPPPRPPSLCPSQRPPSSLFSAYTRDRDLDPVQVPGPEGTAAAGARSSEEDAKREELARDIMGRDKSLVDVLDQRGRMTTMDLMEGLFPSEEQVLGGTLQRRRTSAGSRLPTASPRSMDRREEEDVSSASASLVPSSSYYNTSAPKAELLIKMKDMQEQLEEQDSEDELDVDLASKKQQLICSLAGKLAVLREARLSLQEDVEDNEALGRDVEATVQRLCQPNQLDKFRMFVGDLDKVVSLLLSLSGRLARVENALNSLEEEAPPEEKRTLTEKRKLLMRQHEDAKELKENLDRRERLVAAVMDAHLDAESLDDYRHFVKMKSALIIEQRKLEDKIKLGEEQLKCLLDSLPLEQRPAL